MALRRSLHFRKKRAGDTHQAKDIGLEHRDPIAIFRILDGVETLRATGIIYEEVNFGRERGCEGINGCNIGDITDKRRPADFLCEGFDTVFPACGAPDVVTGGCESFGGGGSDTAGCASNNSNWACGHGSILPEVGVLPPRGEDSIALLVPAQNVGPEHVCSHFFSLNVGEQ
jgi:hypothetical protein